MNIGFILNVTNLIILITDILKTASIECCSKIFSFNSLSCDKNFLASCTNTGSSIMLRKGLKTAQKSSILLTSAPNLEL